MIAVGCIKLTGCTTGQVVYASAGEFGSVQYLWWESEVGNVINITYGLPFEETYYTLTYICNPYDEPTEDCTECKDGIGVPDPVVFSVDPITELPIEATSTGSVDCPGSAYVLINCNAGDITFTNPDELDISPLRALVTQADLAFYVNSVVNIEEYPDYCYRVLGPYLDVDSGCPCPVYTVTNSHEDCECCIEDQPTPFVRTTQDPVKVFYRILQAQCDINANIRFANAFYNIYLKEAWGVEPCCENIDPDKALLKKLLSDFQTIYDPTACVVEEEVAAEACVGPTPVTCDIPLAISGTGSFTLP